MILDWKRKTKKFSGEVYKYYIHAENKTVATSTAQWLRSEGKKARVTPLTGSTTAKYIVWVRNAGKK